MKKTAQTEELAALWKQIKSFGLLFNLMAVAVLLIVVFLMINLVMEGGQLALHYRVAQAKIEIFEATSQTKPNPPSQQRYEFLTDELRAFKPLETQLEERNFVWRKFDYSDKERLEFKERLFSSRQSFKKMADARHVVFEKTAELPDFDQLLPSKEELPKLFMELELSEEIRKTLIDSGASYVHEMNFPQAQVQDFGENVEQYAYTHTTLFYTNWPGLLSFLRNLAQSENLWHIDKIIVENKPSLQNNNLAETPAALTQDSAYQSPDAPLHVNLVAAGTFYARKISS